MKPLPKPAFELPAGCTPQREELTLRDGYVTSVYVHSEATGLPEKLPVVYMHGIQSHPAWFYRSARTLADAGHRVFQVTRRGSGDNSVRRGHCENPQQLFKDIDSAVEFATAATGSEKVILLGVSWGSKLICAYALSSAVRQAKIARLVLVAPGLFSLIDVPLRQKLAIVACFIAGRRGAMFDIPLGDVELFTANGPMQNYLRDDEYQLRKASAAFMLTSKKIDITLRKAAAASLDVPVSLILSEDDKIIDNASTQKWLARVCHGGLEVQILTGAHTLEFERSPDDFLRAVGNACRTEKAEKS